MASDSKIHRLGWRPDPLAELVRELAREAAKPVTARGGWGAMLRRDRELMRRAAEKLSQWGRRSQHPQGQGELLSEMAYGHASAVAGHHAGERECEHVSLLTCEQAG
ncbi:protein of unknown function (plasmid) [Rhodovastum atsumiense]|nr:protein of unknown function [Rhodovastum atsumiense]